MKTRNLSYALKVSVIEQVRKKISLTTYLGIQYFGKSFKMDFCSILQDVDTIQGRSWKFQLIGSNMKISQL